MNSRKDFGKNVTKTIVKEYKKTLVIDVTCEITFSAFNENLPQVFFFFFY